MTYGLTGVLTKMQTKRVSYTFNRNGYYYFSRRVPVDLRQHYLCERIVQGLNTKCPSTAKTRAKVAVAKLDEYWSHLRMTDPKLMGQHMLRSAPKVNVNGHTTVAVSSISLTEALQTYLTVKGKHKGKTFHAAAERACKYLVDATSLKELHEYTRQDALSFRDYLIAKGLAGSSVTRVFNSLTSVLNFAISEYALDVRNPFSRVYYDRSHKVKKRLPIPIDVIKDIQRECYKIDDEIRWLIALISDTGMRLSEAAGLSLSDLRVDPTVPHVVIASNSWRSLKTESSERTIPLVGCSLWAAKRIVRESYDPQYAFPRYNKSNTTNSNSASAALNKWLKSFCGQARSIHSFRHSMRDRLRNAGCPIEMIDQIGGWKAKTVGQQYGAGYSLQSQSSWMLKTCLVNNSDNGNVYFV